MAAKLRSASSNGGAEASLLLLLLFFCLLFVAEVSSQSTEQQILLQIKQDWGDQPAFASWTASSSSTDHCQWRGVGCAGDGSVESISLSNVSISGKIPSSICDLKNLSNLDLSYNRISGAFPTVLYSCLKLESLNISENQFAGEIPADVDRLSSRLTVINLQNNNFTGDVPASFGRFPALQELCLDTNMFNGTFPAELGNLSNLEELTLGANPFSPMSIPPDFGNLTKLTFLWMKRMNLKGEIPSTFGNLTSIVDLDLSHNSLTGEIPAGIWALKNLNYLYLYSNNLTGPISIEGTIGALGLLYIDLDTNELTGPIPEDFGKLTGLQGLVLHYNQFSGDIPASIGLLPFLYDFRIFNNKLTGVLPPELGKHSPLYLMEADDNMINGELPKYLCANGSLNTISVSNNKMNGTIPTSLSNCASLRYFMIQNNGFTGEVPKGIWAINMTTVQMYNNALTGTIPDRLPEYLSRLEIQNNRFSGSIPSAAGRLLVFSASDNQFTGDLPTSFADISNLQVLSLGGNHISGSIPEDVSSLKLLTELNLSHNQLSGSIPASIGSMQVLTTLDLSANELSGAIPQELGSLKLNTLNLSSNQLSGEVPSSLQISAYDQSFLSNPNLCTSTSTSLLGVSACGSRSGSSSNGFSRRLWIVLLVVGVVAVGIVAFAIFDYRRRRRRDDKDIAAWKLTSFQNIDFTESSIKRGLTEENVIGAGGFGKVYKITIGNGGNVVAVKMIRNSNRKLDAKLEKEFESEVQILGSIRHMNIVKLLCCISSIDSKLMVYEYMEKGSLDKWLHGRRQPGAASFPTLDWPSRLRVAIGAARGLCYMHHGCSPPIIHRDVKSSNILLDSEFNARIADFGLARILVKTGERESISMVTGSLGYMAPECAYSRANEKTDVYSFGVVLLELTTGREAGDGGKLSSLAEWAWRHVQDGRELADALDSELRKDPLYAVEMATVFRIGLVCASALPSARPSMKEVLQILSHCDSAKDDSEKGADGIATPQAPQEEFDVAPLLQNKLGSRHKSQHNRGEDDQFENIV